MTDDDDKKHREREAEEVGCFGLVEGWARNLYTHRPFHASACKKTDGPFYCPECFSDAVVRKCIEKRDHFAHQARLSPVIGPEESDLHDQCKREICELLQKRFPKGNWEKERQIPERQLEGLSKLKPDISGRINGQRLVIEVQLSSLSIAKIIKRLSGYTQRKIPMLWIIPLTEPLGDQPFRPRLFERYLHSIYLERAYYWWSGLGLTVKPVHHGLATRHVEYREWYEEGELMSGGDYEKPYKIVKSPWYGRDINIAEDFIAKARDEFTPQNERKAVPQYLIWQDTLNSWWD